MNWREQLLKMALLGTERDSSPLPTPPDALAGPFARLGSLDRESALLGALGLAAVYRLAGRLPDPDSGPAPNPCPADERPVCQPGAAIFLSRILAGEHPRLLAEFLTALDSVGKRVPEELLPGLLEEGRTERGIRDVAGEVMGERGKWLAGQNPVWVWAVAVEEPLQNEDLWETGSREERLALLRALRATSPDRAVKLLQSTWKDETAEDRAAFVGAIETGLSPADEPFLESVLDDRRKEVRTAAAQLLMRLDSSSLVERMEARLKLGWQEGTPGKLLQLKRSTPALVQVELPVECDKSMQRDGVEPKPRPGRGEKAWWLEQMLAAVPPVRWSTRWSKTPGDIVDAGLASEWFRPLLNGWLQATLRHPDPAWAKALLAYWTTERSDERRIELYSAGILQLLTQLDQPAAEDFVARLTKGDRLTRSLFWLCLPYLQTGWSFSFSTLVLAQLRSALVSATDAPPGLADAIRHASLAIDPRLASDIAGTDWEIPEQMWGVPPAINNLITVVQFRRDMLKELGL